MKNVDIIGWGDVPTDPNCSYDNAAVLEMIQKRLKERAPRDPNALQQLEHIITLNGQSVFEKLGMRSRQYRFEKSSTELARIAAERALQTATRNDPNFSPKKIGLVVSGGSSPDDLYPACAAHLQHELGIGEAEGFDVSLACCSGTQAMIEATRALLCGSDAAYALVAVGETIGSRCNDLLDENALIWGDGGGAVVLSSYGGGNRNFGVQATRSRIDGSLAGTTRSRGIGADIDHRSFELNASMEGRGREIYGWVIGPVAEALKLFLEEHRVKLDDRTFLLPHNGNLRMIQAVARKIGLPSEQILHRITDRANQSSASIFSTLAHYADGDCFRHGDQLILASFGGGVAYNFVLYRWP